MISQRTTALSAAIATSSQNGKVKRGETANTTISAITPSTHRLAMVSPPYPACCQAMEANV